MILQRQGTDPKSRYPGEPTDAPPGSEEKIRILIERAARRQPLFHPMDEPRSRIEGHRVAGPKLRSLALRVSLAGRRSPIPAESETNTPAETQTDPAPVLGPL
jgi:hypothetical protein